MGGRKGAEGVTCRNADIATVQRDWACVSAGIMRAKCITGHGAEGEGSAAAVCNLLIVLLKAFLYRTGKLLALSVELHDSC